MAKKQTRFEVVYKEGGLTSRKVWVDKETGVNYLFISEGYAGGLTVLVDTEGKPLVSKVSTFRSE